MKAQNLKYFDFDAEINDESVIECPFCKAHSCVSEWSLSDFYDESCWDYHDAITCPDCLGSFDYIMNAGVKKDSCSKII